jgi:SAM-dependent methyltransferase
MQNNTVYEWILPTFAVSARAKSLRRMEPFLAPLVKPGDNVLDLCCGSGPACFWFERRGANVTGMDSAPYMISLANEEAARRRSSVEFVEADIFTYDLGWQCYDLISCLGNSIVDFPLSEFSKLVKNVTDALKPGGKFVLQYHDGSYAYMTGSIVREGLYQEVPERVTFSFKEYLPETGACVKIIRNETRAEEYLRTAYIYTVPVVHLAVNGMLDLERHVILEENHFLDIFI